jgi:hypothetical protein
LPQLLEERRKEQRYEVKASSRSIPESGFGFSGNAFRPGNSRGVKAYSRSGLILRHGGWREMKMRNQAENCGKECENPRK